MSSSTLAIPSSKSLHLLQLPSEIVDAIVDLVLRTWDAYIRAAAMIPKERIKMQMQEFYEAMLRGQTESIDGVIPGTKWLHLHSLPTHGTALVLVCKKLREHCIRWRKIANARPSQAYFSGRTVFRDSQSFELHENIYYPRKLYTSWAVRFPDDLKEDRVPKQVAQRSAEWLKYATRILEVRVDAESAEYWEFDKFKQYCPSAEDLIMVFEKSGVAREGCCSQSNEWCLRQKKRLPARCFEMSVRTSSRLLFHHNPPQQGSKQAGSGPESKDCSTCVISINHALKEPLNASLAGRLSLEKVGNESFDGHECYYGLASWQLSQIRHMEEDSHQRHQDKPSE